MTVSQCFTNLIVFNNKTSVACDLEIGMLSECANRMLTYSTDIYDLENIEKFVLFQKLQWPLYSRSCILCEVKRASITGTNQFFLQVFACLPFCVLCYLALASCNFNIILSTKNFWYKFTMCKIWDSHSEADGRICCLGKWCCVFDLYLGTSFSKGLLYLDRGKMLYWNVGTSVAIYTCNIPEDWQLSPMGPNILYVHNVKCDACNAKCCICSCAALSDGVLI